MPVIKDNKTGRGFSVFGELIDTRNSKIIIQRSSAAFQDCIWILSSNTHWENPSPHLSKSQVKDLIEILQHAHENMTDEELERNGEETLDEFYNSLYGEDNNGKI